MVALPWILFCSTLLWREIASGADGEIDGWDTQACPELVQTTPQDEQLLLDITEDFGRKL